MTDMKVSSAPYWSSGVGSPGQTSATPPNTDFLVLQLRQAGRGDLADALEQKQKQLKLIGPGGPFFDPFELGKFKAALDDFNSFQTQAASTLGASDSSGLPTGEAPAPGGPPNTDFLVLQLRSQGRGDLADALEKKKKVLSLIGPGGPFFNPFELDKFKAALDDFNSFQAQAASVVQPSSSGTGYDPNSTYDPSGTGGAQPVPGMGPPTPSGNSQMALDVANDLLSGKATEADLRYLDPQVLSQVASALQSTRRSLG